MSERQAKIKRREIREENWHRIQRGQPRIDARKPSIPPNPNGNRLTRRTAARNHRRFLAKQRAEARAEDLIYLKRELRAIRQHARRYRIR